METHSARGSVRFQKQVARQADLLSGLEPQSQVNEDVRNRRACNDPSRNRIRHGIYEAFSSERYYTVVRCCSGIL